MQRACFTQNFWLKDRRWIPTGIVCNLTITQATHPQNQAGKKHVSFASRQRKATLQCTNSGRHDMPEIHSGTTPSLQTRFGAIRFLIAPKIEGDVKRSTFFVGRRNWGSCVQMDQQPTRNFFHRRNEQMDRKNEVMCSRKWWLCWKICVQCVREKICLILISLLLFYTARNIFHTIGDITYQSSLVTWKNMEQPDRPQMALQHGACALHAG
jgi:hypothetical protein